MTGDQLTLGAVLARLEEREQQIAAQTEAAKERIAELSAQLEEFHQPPKRSASPASAHAADQARRGQAGDHQGEQPVREVVRGHPVAELAEDGVVEAGIIQGKAQAVLPVQPAAHRFGGLADGQVLRILQDLHHGQPGRRQAPARLADTSRRSRRP
ncbi:hypothetical protein [Streptomyces canus]